MDTDEDILNYWFEQRNLGVATQMQYRYAMKHYCKITNKTVKELYLEADNEEENGLRFHKRKYSHYILKYKIELENQNKSPLSIRAYVNAIKMFYSSLGILLPELKIQ